MLFEIVIELLLLLQESNDCAIVQIHDVVAHFGSHCIRVSLQIIDLCHAQLDFIEGLADMVCILILAFEQSVDFGLDLLGLFDQLAEERVARFCLQLHLAGLVL